MKCFLALASCLMLAAPASPPGYNTRMSSAAAPERFQGDNGAIVLFLTDVTQVCGKAAEGFTMVACLRRADDGTPVMVLPNPCRFSGDRYGHIVCHELGHVNGWSGDHPL